jgi:hypothetical protein
MVDEHPLPLVYERWLHSLLGRSNPQEPRATCDDCAMCPRPEEPREAAATYFEPDTKCCSFMPELPNHVVGRILADVSPENEPGRASTLARIRAGTAVTPLGLGSAPTERARCPHLVDGDRGARCGIHAHRNSACATWFCKHDRGEIGRSFWRATHRFLAAIEASLARHCLGVLDVGEESLALLIATQRTVEEVPYDPATQRPGLLWGRWASREPEFFVACAELVEPLSLAEVLAIGGPEVRLAATLLERAAAVLVEDAPLVQLRMGRLHQQAATAGVRRVATYSPLDPLDLPVDLLDVLHHFDGRPVAAVLQDLAENAGIELDEALVRKLVDFRVLEPPETP